MKKNDFIQQKMVNWYRPKMLLSVALKAIISGTFGNYADRRELEAALDTNVSDDVEWNELKVYYGGKETWIDIINDTGDGFNSTFAIAKSVAKSQLEFEYSDKDGTRKKVITQRARILIFGGDEVYPFPTREAYENRFKVPFASALNNSECDEPKEKERPHLYAIPGNHDWYDGLGNFIKVFCQQRKIGIWDTKQHRSYFALPLSNHYWIWAIDIQLNSDIDAPQLKYFISIIAKMEEGDSVILVTAEPAWVYKAIHKHDKSFERLSFFIDEYIYNKDNCTGKNFKLAAAITGDLHHYARYCSTTNQNGRQYITAGGGGAFLHLTHNLPQELDFGSNNKLGRMKVFPEEKTSKRLLLGNFAFPFINRFFTFLIGCIYIFSYWIFNAQEKIFFNGIDQSVFSILDFISRGFQLLIYSPGAIMFTILIGGGFYAFTDAKGLKPFKARSIGLVHCLGQIFVFFLVTYSIHFFEQILDESSKFICLTVMAATCFLGGVVSSLLMGTYLYLSNLICNMHINEASSSLACPHYKSFLRVRVHADGVTIYPIGIKKVPKGWTQNYNQKNDTYSFTGREVEAFLIENPIEINSSKLY